MTTVKGPGAGYGSSGPATIYSTSRDAHGVVGSSDNGIGVFGIGINGAAMQATSVGTAPGLNVFAIGGGTGINVFHNQPTGLGVSIQKLILFRHWMFLIQAMVQRVTFYQQQEKQFSDGPMEQPVDYMLYMVSFHLHHPVVFQQVFVEKITEQVD